MRRGFTLIELAIVVAMIAAVAVIAIQRFGGVTQRAERTATEAELEQLRGALEIYFGDMEKFRGFDQLFVRPSDLLTPTNHNFAAWDDETRRGWRGPYLSPHLARTFPDRSATTGLVLDKSFYPKVGGNFSTNHYYLVTSPVILDSWGNPYVLQFPEADAFSGSAAEIAARRRLYARLVSAGPNGKIETPLAADPAVNDFPRTLSAADRKRAARLAGRLAHDLDCRGDDLVLFLFRSDIYEENEISF